MRFMAIAALVLGIVSLVSSLGLGAVGFGWIGTIMAITAIVLGAISKKSDKKGLVGMILGIVALSWGLIATIVCFACGAAIAAFS